MKCLAPKSGGVSEWFNKEGKLEYTLQNCTTDHYKSYDTCFNLEDTYHPKHKGCGKLETLVEDLSYMGRNNSKLNATDIPIKKDECKKISGAANKKLIKAMGFDDETIKRMKNKELETITIFQWNQGNMAFSHAKKYRLKTLCTCSEDGCNGGNKIEAKFYKLVITAFIVSRMFRT